MNNVSILRLVKSSCLPLVKEKGNRKEKRGEICRHLFYTSNVHVLYSVQPTTSPLTLSKSHPMVFSESIDAVASLSCVPSAFKVSNTHILCYSSVRTWSRTWNLIEEEFPKILMLNIVLLQITWKSVKKILISSCCISTIYVNFCLVLLTVWYICLVFLNQVVFATINQPNHVFYSRYGFSS